MFSFFLLLIFIYCCYVGYRRGLIYEGAMAVGYVISFILACLLYRPFSSFLTMWVPYPSASDNSSFAFFRALRSREYTFSSLKSSFLAISETDRFSKYLR